MHIRLGRKLKKYANDWSYHPCSPRQPKWWGFKMPHLDLHENPDQGYWVIIGFTEHKIQRTFLS